MDDEIELIGDDDGLLVNGNPAAVEEFLRAEGLWASATRLDLRQLDTIFGVGADAAQAASGVAANSARWLKLTPESAQLRVKYGLMESKVPGVRHAMVGKPGSIKSWLQTEQGSGALLSNPALLSGAAGIMAQAAMRQTMAEITDYLATIGEKVDDLRRKQDDAMVAQMVGTGYAVERAMTIREEMVGVSETLWSTVDQAHQTIGATQAYALDQLDTIAEKFECIQVSALATTARQAESEVPRWLAVLARCFQLQDAIDVIELDRALGESPAKLDAYRRGLKKARLARRKLVSGHTANLLDRMNTAVGTANAKMLWNRSRCFEVVDSANHLAAGVHNFHGLLRIESDPRSWQERRLGPAADLGSQTIQKTKDTAPYIATGVGLIAFVAVAGKKLQGEGTT
ncbi:hypothetical protein AB0K20_17185 [Micromonospora matsumotoense]|uniref:hypothetical protein n=1 Tax=Micromonospora matsumotoense TaxID=121616 RepID=UPI003430B87A